MSTFFTEVNKIAAPRNIRHLQLWGNIFLKSVFIESKTCAEATIIIKRRNNMSASSYTLCNYINEELTLTESIDLRSEHGLEKLSLISIPKGFNDFYSVSIPNAIINRIQRKFNSGAEDCAEVFHAKDCVVTLTVICRAYDNE